MTKSTPENFYQGFLNGVFSTQTNLFSNFESNAVAGDGYADIMFCKEGAKVGVIIELKSVKDENALIRSATDALAQIEAKKYADAFALSRVQKIYCYGIAFCHRTCFVQCEEKTL